MEPRHYKRRVASRQPIRRGGTAGDIAHCHRLPLSSSQQQQSSCSAASSRRTESSLTLRAEIRVDAVATNSPMNHISKGKKKNCIKHTLLHWPLVISVYFCITFTHAHIHSVECVAGIASELGTLKEFEQI